MDRSFWLDVRENGFATPQGQDHMRLTEELLLWLGSPDPELRDAIAYETLAHWLEQGLYSVRQRAEIGERMAENLSRGLGEAGTDSVFLRSFSSLILGEAVAADMRDPALPEPVLRAWRGRATHYLVAERDERGFVPDRGWAHATAHTADCLGAFAAHPVTGRDGLEAIMHAVVERVLRHGADVFLFDEERRLAFACLRVLQRTEWTGDDMQAWLARFARPRAYATWREASGDEVGARSRLNAKAFLLELYFQGLWAKAEPPGRGRLLEAIGSALQVIGTGPYDV